MNMKNVTTTGIGGLVVGAISTAAASAGCNTHLTTGQWLAIGGSFVAAVVSGVFHLNQPAPKGGQS